MSGFVHANRPVFSVLGRALDGLAILCALLFTTHAYGVALTDSYWLAAALAVALFWFAAEWGSLYRVFRGSRIAEEIRDFSAAWIVVVLVLLSAGFLTKRSANYSRLAVTLWFALAPVAIGAWRMTARVVLRFARAHGRNTRSVAIAGAGVLGVRVAEYIHANPWLGLRIIGFFDDFKAEGTRPTDLVDVRVLGNLDDMAVRASRGELELVYVTLPMRAEQRLRELLLRLSDSTASVYVVPDIFTVDLLCSRTVSLGEIHTFSVFENPFHGLDGWLKRVEDIVLASMIMVVIAVPMLLIAIAVKLTSAGPVIFRQRRYGLDGREIEVWKFRSMTVCEDGPDVPQAQRNDARVTRLGAFLRRTSLDELPQFINVLQGRMSVVGPRPHAVAHNEMYRSLIRGYMLRHKVKPGITGWAQVNGWRGETDTIDKMERRVEHDLWYIRNWSAFLDLRIVALTVLRGFVGRDVY
jgi:putative colanic acid biosynthesis UDP-glucose lipid carrier transferase